MIEIVQRPLFELVQETHQLLCEKEALEGQYIDVVVRIGQKLIAMRPYKPYGEFILWLEDEFNISSDTAYNYMHVAEIYGDNSERVRNFPLRVVYEIASPKMPEKIREQVEIGQIPATIPAIREAKQEVQTKVEIPEEWKLPTEMRIAPNPVVAAPRNVDNIPIAVPHISSKNNEWYTPWEYIAAARHLMGSIDLDPASNEFANETVMAKTYYDISMNGLDKEWAGRVWLNPPYGRSEAGSNQDIWSRRLIEQYNAGITTEALLLVNAAIDTKWFHRLFEFPVCLTLGRINFTTPESVANGSTHGSAFIYFGSQIEKFVEIFGEFGTVVKRW